MTNAPLCPSRPAVLLLALVMLTACLATGCGYAHRELYPQQYQTVAVPIFENRTYYRDIERDLTEAIVKELEQRTPYKVVPQTQAGTALVGVITAIDQDMLSRTRVGGVPQEVQVTLRVDFQWRDLRTGDTLVDRRGFEAVGRHVPTTPVGQPFEVAQHGAVQRLAEAIVSSMRADW